MVDPDIGGCLDGDCVAVCFFDFADLEISLFLLDNNCGDGGREGLKG
jgi:hypothetical protein